MNGAQQTKETASQKPPQGATPPAPANGNSALNKKRKKDGLKPIITTEGPGYVHCAFCSVEGINRYSCCFAPFLLAISYHISSNFEVLRSVSLVGCKLDATRCAPLDKWRGAMGGDMGPI